MNEYQYEHLRDQIAELRRNIYGIQIQSEYESKDASKRSKSVSEYVAASTRLIADIARTGNADIKAELGVLSRRITGIEDNIREILAIARVMLEKEEN